MKDLFQNWKGKWADNDTRMKILMVVSVGIGGILLVVAAILALVYYLQIQWILYKRSDADPNQVVLNAKKPYRDTMEYQVMSPSIFTKYSYRGIFYLSAVAFTFMILAYLFKIQMGMSAAGTATGGPADPFKEDEHKPVFLGLVASLYVFVVAYWFIEKGYYAEIVQFNAKITDFNQFVRSILPGNYKFLTVISAPPKEVAMDSTYIAALESLNPNKRELVRALCVLNLYTYYVENAALYTAPGGLQNVLDCFNPINRIIPVAPACFSDHLINTSTYVENGVGKYISLIEGLDAAKSPIKDVFQKRRTEILVEVDKIMGEINQRGSCLGSGTAYNKFLRMNTRVFVLLWVPIIFLLAFKSSSAVRTLLPGAGTGTR